MAKPKPFPQVEVGQVICLESIHSTNETWVEVTKIPDSVGIVVGRRLDCAAHCSININIRRLTTPSASSAFREFNFDNVRIAPPCEVIEYVQKRLEELDKEVKHKTAFQDFYARATSTLLGRLKQPAA